MPERERDITVKSDMWSLGSVLWTLMNAPHGMPCTRQKRVEYQQDIMDHAPCVCFFDSIGDT